MYERFTDRARQVMQLAIQQAQRRGHDQVDTEHILLGLAKQDTGVGAEALKNLRVDRFRLQVEVALIIPPDGPMNCTSIPPLADNARKAIEYATEESRKRDNTYIGTEHLLLGLLQVREGKAAQVLIKLLLEESSVRLQVFQWFARSVSGSQPDVLGSFDRAVHRIMAGRGSVRARAVRSGRRAQCVMRLAAKEARRLRHEYVGTEHILLSVLRKKSNIGAGILIGRGVNLKKVRTEIRKFAGAGTPRLLWRVRLPLTPIAMKTIEHAGAEALKSNNNEIEVEHLLLGLLRESNSLAARVLVALGVDLDDLRSEIVRELSTPSG